MKKYPPAICPLILINESRLTAGHHSSCPYVDFFTLRFVSQQTHTRRLSYTCLSPIIFGMQIHIQGLSAATSESPVCVFICCKTGSGPLLFSPPSQKEADENCCLFAHLQVWFCSIFRHNAGFSLHAMLKPW